MERILIKRTVRKSDSELDELHFSSIEKRNYNECFEKFFIEEEK